MTETTMIDDVLAQHALQKSHLDFMGEVFCPIKQRFRDAYLEFERQDFAERGTRHYSFVPTSCPEDVPVENTLRDISLMKTLDQVPDICLGASLQEMQQTGFFDRFVATGCFQQVIEPSECGLTHKPEFDDRYHTFNTLALFPHVLMVDIRRLGDRPMPKRIEDLLDPVYKGSIGIPDSHECIGTNLLMYLYKEYGDEGLTAFEHNVLTGFHGPEGARTAGHNNVEPAAALYILPWIFAAGAEHAGSVEIVWPEEGVLVSPTSLLVRKDIAPENEALLEWVLSEEVGHIFADNHLLSTNPHVDNQLPEGVNTANWVGWDWLYDNDIATLDAQLAARFARFHRKGSC